MLRESFFYILRYWTVDNFSKVLFGYMPECNLSAMVKAASDNVTVVEDCYVSVKRTACTCDEFLAHPLVFDAFGVRQ